VAGVEPARCPTSGRAADVLQLRHHRPAQGILPPLLDVDLGAVSFLTRLLTGLFGFTRDTVYLSPAPLYHAAPGVDGGHPAPRGHRRS